MSIYTEQERKKASNYTTGIQYKHCMAYTDVCAPYIYFSYVMSIYYAKRSIYGNKECMHRLDMSKKEW